MAAVVTIGGVDRSRAIAWDSLRVDRILTKAIDTCGFKIKRQGLSEFKPITGQSVTVTDGGTTIFGGVIIRVTERAIAYGLFEYDIECSDFGRLLDSKLVAATYQNQTVNAIIADLVANHFVAGFTTTKVNCATKISYLKLNYLPGSEVLNKLSELTGYDWYIDSNKDIYFDIPDPTAAPIDIEDDNGSFEYESLILRSDNSQVRNTIYIRGGEYLGAAFTASLEMDGKQTVVNLPYRYTNFHCSLTGEPRTVGLDNINTFDDYDVLYNYSEKLVKFNNPPSSGAVFSFAGYPHYPVRTKLKHQASIDSMFSAEGSGDGIYEYLVIDNSINSKEGSRQRARAEIETYAQTVVEGEFITETSGFSTGQKVRLNLASRGIDTYYIISRVMAYSRTPTELKYKIYLISTKTFGFIDLLRRLILKETTTIKVDDNETVDYMESAEETMALSEAFASSTAADYQFAETETAGDAFASAVDTPPVWLVGDYHPWSNYVLNPNFESVPPFTAAQTLAGRYINGTANGSITDTTWHWWGDTFGGSTVQFDESVFYGGAASLKMVVPAGAYCQAYSNNSNTSWGNDPTMRFPIIPGHTYRFSAWIKTENMSGDSAHGVHIAMLVSKADGTSHATVIPSGYIKTNVDWTLKTIDWVATAGSAWAFARATFYGHTGAATLGGTAWFDDISVVKIPADDKRPAFADRDCLLAT